MNASLEVVGVFCKERLVDAVMVRRFHPGLDTRSYVCSLRIGEVIGKPRPSVLPFYISLGFGLAATTGTVVWAVRWLSRPGDDTPNRFGAEPQD